MDQVKKGYGEGMKSGRELYLRPSKNSITFLSGSHLSTWHGVAFTRFPRKPRVKASPRGCRKEGSCRQKAVLWRLFLDKGWLENTISSGRFWILKSTYSVPLYAPGQNSRNEKYIQTSIAN
jgi:hypothetical protein